MNKPAEPKACVMWAYYDEEGNLWEWTVRLRRHAVMRAAEGNAAGWRSAYRKGCRVRKVRVEAA